MTHRTCLNPVSINHSKAPVRYEISVSTFKTPSKQNYVLDRRALLFGSGLVLIGCDLAHTYEIFYRWWNVECRQEWRQWIGVRCVHSLSTMIASLPNKTVSHCLRLKSTVLSFLPITSVSQATPLQVQNPQYN